MMWLLFACITPGDTDTPPPLDDTGEEPIECPEGQVAVDAVCEDIDLVCGNGTWGGIAVDEQSVFVDAAAAAGGNGTRVSPLSSLQAAVDLAGEAGGGIVAVAAGAYGGGLVLDERHDDVVISGRCQDRVSLEGGVTVTLARGQGLTLNDLVLTGGAPGLDVVTGTVTLNGVTIADSIGGGARITGPDAAVIATDLAISGVTEWTGSPAGMGLGLSGGASLTATGLTIADAAVFGVYATDDDSRLDVTNLAVTGTVARADGWYGNGLFLFEGPTANIDGCMFDANTSVQVAVYDAAARLSDCSFTNPVDPPDGLGGLAIDMSAGDLVCTRCTITGARGEGVRVSGAYASAQLVDSTISDTEYVSTGGPGTAVHVASGASLGMSGVTISGSHMTAIEASESASLDMVGCTVSGTDPTPDGNGGSGVFGHNYASVSISDSVIEDNKYFGVLIYYGSTVTIVDSSIVRTTFDSRGNYGVGLYVGIRSKGFLSDVTIEDSGTGGVVAGSDSSLELWNVDVDGVARGSGTNGYRDAHGLVAFPTAELVGSNVSVSNVEGPGLWASNSVASCAGCTFSQSAFAGVVIESGSLTLSDTIIEDIAVDEIFGGGVGIYVEDSLGTGSTVDLRDNTVGPQPYAALWFAGAGSYTVTGNDLDGGAGTDGLGGDAVHVLGLPTAGSVVLTGNTFSGGAEAGVFLDGSSATFDGNTWSGTATDVIQQNCDGVEPPVGLDAGVLAGLCADVRPVPELSYLQAVQCDNGQDDDGDGWIDAADPDCASGTAETGVGDTECNDGLDNDGDLLLDAADPDCTDALDTEEGP